MALQDKIQEETNEVKNSLEAYIYSLRGKLADAYAEYSTEQERSTASAQLEKMEVTLLLSPSWLAKLFSLCVLSKSVGRHCLHHKHCQRWTALTDHSRLVLCPELTKTRLRAALMAAH